MITWTRLQLHIEQVIISYIPQHIYSPETILEYKTFQPPKIQFYTHLTHNYHHSNKNYNDYALITTTNIASLLTIT